MPSRPFLRIPLTLLRAFAFLLVAALIIVVAGSVILRIFGIVPSGSVEFSTLIFVWLIYIGAFLAFLEGGHLAITAITNRLRGRAFTAVLIISDALLLFFTVFVTVASFDYVVLALESVRVTPSLHISPAWHYSAVLVGMFLVSLYVLTNIGINIRRLVKGEEAPRGTDDELEDLETI